jgi:hypothetical protein
MRKLSRKLALCAAITTATLFAADNSIGTWKMNFAKSTFPNATATLPKSVLIVYEALDGGVKATTIAELKDGKTNKGGYTARYDGKEYPQTSPSADTISLRQIDANTFSIEEKKTGGSYRTSGRKVVSEDGLTLTFTREGTDADGKAIRSL